MAFLHGTLNLKVEKANKLPNLDKSFLSFSKKDVSDPFVVVSLKDGNGETCKIATTRVIDDNLNPVWDENFQVDVCHEVVSIIFTVRDKDFVSSENLGSVSFPANTLYQKACESGTFDLMKKSKKKGTLTLTMSYTNKHNLEHSYEVPDCLFPLRQDNQVKLYQDACCPSLPLPLVDASGYLHQPCNTWYDIYKTIMDAKHFIYITGWSVSTKTALIRDEGYDNRCLGEILKQKAFEGVQVRLLLWDELTSTDLNKGGIMSTNDEETSNFFKGTSVKVVKACRDRNTNSMFSTKVHFTMLCFSHHQKCVIADAPIHEIPGQRKLVAYVGGLDLTSGRYDTPEHPLFHTLLKEHKDDFYNQVFPTLSNNNGPRQPWHDIHSCVEGPAAHDVLSNFLDRWHKQAGHHVGEIMKLQEILNVVMEYHSPSPDRWNVQIFRSINSDSAMFNWTSAASLKKKKGRAFDNSLHRAYIHNIRRARRCIYIENQYFLGSSHMWQQSRDANAGNLVPLEISIKIEEKIRARERFAVYIVIPMFPEGKPADKVTQEILYWQSRTLQMMYSRIAVAIRQAGIEAHPQEYLLVLCLGSKESPRSVPQQLVAPGDPSTSLPFKNRRHMIYVHSKMAIFDDEYIIVGSANINDRSLNGNRDTEIAMGSYQPIHTATGYNLANGSVSLFRKALWAEHMGTAAPINIDPSSIECVRSVRWLAEEALRAYIAPGDAPTPRHLLLYPLHVNLDGSVCARPDCPTFPDTSGSVIGARSNVLPTPLTT